MSRHVLTWSKPASAASLAAGLAKGKIAITTSDTVLGFLAPLTLEGFNKLDYLKKRSNRPYLILMGSSDKLSYFTDQQLSPGLQRIIDQCWPGPVTIIVKSKSTLPSHVPSPDGTIAVRVPLHQGLLEVLSHFDGLFSTSANLHGCPVPSIIDEIDSQVLAAIDFLVTDEMQVSDKENKPSTLLDCTGEQIRVIREGAYSIAQLEAIYGAPFVKPLT